MKKIFTLIAALVCTFSFASAASKGKCGANVSWAFDKSTGILTISGTGEMYDYDFKKDKRAPWKQGSHDVKMSKVVIQDGVTRIGTEAFVLCYDLVSINIPQSVVSIQPNSINFNLRLTTITVDPKNPNYCDVNGVLFSKDKTILVCYPEGRKKSYSIPDGVTEIGDYAFLSTELSEVYLPNSVKKIGFEAFAHAKIKRIVLSNSLTTIEKSAFKSCEFLSEITLPSSVTIVGAGVFENCKNLRTVRYPKDLSIASATVPAGAETPYDPNDKTVNRFTASNISSNSSSKSASTSASASTVAQTQPQAKSVPQSSPESVQKEQVAKANKAPVVIDSRAFSKSNTYKNSDIKLVYMVAKQGDAEAENDLAYSYHVENKDSIAAIWYAKSAEHGYPAAAYSLGFLYDLGGKGLKKDTKKAVEWYYKAAEMGHRSAQRKTANFYSTGNYGVNKDYEQAIYWYRKAAEQGDADAQYSMGFAYETGKGVEKDYSMAMYWYKKAYDRNSSARGNYDRLKSYGHKEAEVDPVSVSNNPPLLALVSNSRVFSDASKNNRIDADEQCSVRFKIQNNGKGPANRCEARVTMQGSTAGITAKSITLPMIKVGQTYDVEIPITSNINTQDGHLILSVEVYEPNGFGVAPFNWELDTKAYEAPMLQVVDYNIASSTGKIQKMVPFTLSFNLQNIKYGNAENVKVKINLPKDVYVMDGKAEHIFPVIKSGEVKPIQLQLAANNNYTAANIPVTIDIKEKHGKFAENKQLDIALNQTTSSSIKIAANDEPQVERKEIQLAMITSAVDRNIPVSSAKNDNTFVLIIANEHYQQVASVPFALNDGNIFREYCIKTLGISESHIKYLPDATGTQIRTHVNRWLVERAEAFDHPQIIVYYAGHGIPDESNKSAYLLPVDGIGTDVTTGYKLDDLYATLGNLPASQVTVFMDACFSGSKREEGMLASARGVAVRAKSGVPQGKMVVFSAAQGDETAYPNKEQQHGLFTYYLLKKLQETKGDISLKALGDYITKQVSQQSLIINDKKQTPCVIPSATLGDAWQSWKLK